MTSVNRVTICNVNWPHHNQCLAVSFGVPLKYDDDDDDEGDDEEDRLNSKELRYMWETYSKIDPFLSRLSRLGIKVKSSFYFHAIQN